MWYACSALVLCASMIILSLQTINRLSGAQASMCTSFFIAEKLNDGVGYSLPAQEITYRCGSIRETFKVRPFSYKKIVHLGQPIYAAT